VQTKKKEQKGQNINKHYKQDQKSRRFGRKQFLENNELEIRDTAPSRVKCEL
jgi:hypothetical protein